MSLKRDNINYLASGAVVISAFVLLFVVLFSITGRGGDTDSYYTFYNHVAGLRYGTPVYFEGYRVGQVELVTPEIDGVQTRFRIDFSVQKAWPIPADSVAEITTSGLLSDVFIVLQQGKADEVLEPDSMIEGQEASDVFAALNDLALEVQRLTRTELGPLMKLVNERVDGITGNIQERTPAILGQIDEMVGKLNRTASNIETLIGDENLERVSTMLVNFEQMSGSARDLAEELRQTRDQLDATLKELHAAVEENRPDIDLMVDEMVGTLETTSQRLDHIGFNLDEASRNLNEFARAIRMSPNRLIFAQEDDTVEVEE